MFFPPLSDVNPFGALFPQVLESSVWPPVPNPILESEVMQSRWSFPRIPILALAETLWLAAALKPSRLQPVCKEAYEPISDFHLSRPKEVAWKTPPAIRECRELAFMSTGTNFTCWPILMPRQTLVKGVAQQEGNLVSSMSKPVFPPATLYVFVSLHRKES